MTERIDSKKTCLEAALGLAAQGWFVIPGHPTEKRPYTSGDGWSASRDPDLIRSWWGTWPNATVGINVGMSGLFVVDLDIHDEYDNGFESMARQCRSLGKDDDWLNTMSLVTRSGGGGQHHLFRAPDGVDFQSRKIKWMPGVDILVGTSFLVLPPSLHPSGDTYRWLRGPDDFEVEQLPPELLAHFLRRASAVDGTIGLTGIELSSVLVHGSPSGQRNQDLVRMIGWMRRTVGDTTEARMEIRRQLEEWRNLCQPPYRGDSEDAEFERTWQSGLSLSHAERNPNWPVPVEMAEAGLQLMNPRGLADWLKPRYGAFLRWNVDTGTLMVWNDRQWVHDDKQGVAVWTMFRKQGADSELDRYINQVAADMRASGEDRSARALEQWKPKALDQDYFGKAAKTMVADEAFQVSRLDFDSRPELLHCVNGVVNLETGELLPHDPSYMNLNLVPVAYSPIAHSPALARQLEMMFPSDFEMQDFLQQAVGASVFGDNRTKALFVIRGSADTGKSTFMEAIMPVLGHNSGYTQAGQKHIFTVTRNGADRHPEGLAAILGARLVSMSEEYGESDRLNISLLKSITGGDPLAARFIAQNQFVAVPKCTPWLMTNHDVRLTEFDDAVRTRICLIDMEHVIPAQDRRVNVRDEIVAEGEGVLAWIVQGAQKVHRFGLVKPARVLVAVDELIAEQDLVKAWVAERTEPADIDDGTPMSSLYDDYAWWITAQGNHPLARLTFGIRLSRVLVVRAKDLKRVRTESGETRCYPVRLLGRGERAMQISL